MELIVIIKSVVPTAVSIRKSTHKSNAGAMMKPPPIPKHPAIIPVITPNKRSNIIFERLVLFAEFVLTFLLNIFNDMKSIMAAKEIIITTSFDTSNRPTEKNLSGNDGIINFLAINILL